MCDDCNLVRAKIWWRRWGIQSYKLGRDGFKENTDGIVRSEDFGAMGKQGKKKKKERMRHTVDDAVKEIKSRGEGSGGASDHPIRS